MRYLRLTLLWILVSGCVVSSASAAFPGRDGLLAIRPVKGLGVLLANARGGQQRRVCADLSCGVAVAPRWSADGSAIAFATPGTAQARPEARLIYPDGSCLNCSLAAASQPAFAPMGSLSAVSAGRVEQFSSDGLRRAVSGTGVSDAVSSTRGTLAIVHRGDVLIQSGPALELVGVGSSPSWSPGGLRLAYVDHGWIKIFNLQRPAAYRLIRGTSPAWAPDGHSIAFIASDHSVRVITPTGRQANRVGKLRGLSVDWQPIPPTPPAPCSPLPGSIVIANSATATITQDPAGQAIGASSAVMGCLLADGRERSLGSFPVNLSYYGAGVSSTALAGDYAAVVSFGSDFKVEGFNSQVNVYNLRTGRQPEVGGGEFDACGGQACTEESNGHAITGLVLNGQGFTAAHIDDGVEPEQIVASDNTGLHVLDSVPNTTSGPALTNLALNGDTVTWNHNGQPETAQLS